VPSEVFAIGALAELLRESQQAISKAARLEDPYSPWHKRDGWRLNSGFSRTLKFRAGSQEKAIRVTYTPGRFYTLDVDGVPTQARGQLAPNGALRAEFGGRRLSATVIVAGEKRHVFLYGRSYLLSAVDPLYQPGEGAGAESRLTAPMPGRITALLAEPGKVEKGAPLLIMEAMKMEHTIRAPAAGLFKGFRYAVGDQVGEGADLVDFEPESGGAKLEELEPEAVG
jgi:3-methylcrotonyl-CoA carboxylase alpha subunit